MILAILAGNHGLVRFFFFLLLSPRYLPIEVYRLSPYTDLAHFVRVFAIRWEILD